MHVLIYPHSTDTVTMPFSHDESSLPIFYHHVFIIKFITYCTFLKLAKMVNLEDLEILEKMAHLENLAIMVDLEKMLI